MSSTRATASVMITRAKRRKSSSVTLEDFMEQPEAKRTKSDARPRPKDTLVNYSIGIVILKARGKPVSHMSLLQFHEALPHPRQALVDETTTVEGCKICSYDFDSDEKMVKLWAHWLYHHDAALALEAVIDNGDWFPFFAQAFTFSLGSGVQTDLYDALVDVLIDWMSVEGTSSADGSLHRVQKAYASCYHENDIESSFWAAILLHNDKTHDWSSDDDMYDSSVTKKVITYLASNWHSGSLDKTPEDPLSADFDDVCAYHLHNEGECYKYKQA